MDIEIGQVWADRDPRSGGRTVEVMEIGETHAKVRMNTTARNVSRQAIGRRTTVRLDRFGTDYKPSDVPPHRFGRHRESGEVGYWPIGDIA